MDELVFKYLQGALSEEEQRTLDSWLAESPANRARFDEWTDAQRMNEKMRRMAAIDREKGWRRMVEEGTIQPVRRMRRWHWAAAASIMLILTVGAYFWTTNPDNKPSPLTDIPAGKSGAILTLADGAQVSLDTIQNGVVALQGGVKARVVNGTLMYEGTSGQMAYNTMTTPKGRQFQLTLPDGTQVWLNSASSIRYPTVFNGDERNVTITGEAYFEVAPLVKKPFRVDIAGKAMVEVLGTHFNINAYTNESSINTTLLEGRVKVNNVILKPAQQARISNGVVKVMDDVNIDHVIAWKNGFFNFEDQSFREILRQLERWYDVEVVLEKGVPDVSFGGSMSRDVSLSGVLKYFEKEHIHYKLEGRKLTILP